jgi:predicted phosphoribosyltransferase
MKPGLFRDRREAGRVLAERLAAYANRPDVLVLALPRGGVPVAYEVARALGGPFDVFVVRKLGVPGYEELAMGAIATGGVRVLNDQLVECLGIPAHMIDTIAARERQELARRERLYRGGRPPPDVRGRTVILVDDGLATGATMHAAIEALRQQKPARIVVAVPTASPETCEEMKAKADESSAPLRRNRFMRSVAGTRISRRRRTKRFASCSRGKAHRTIARPRKARKRTARSSQHCARSLTRWPDPLATTIR